MNYDPSTRRIPNSSVMKVAELNSHGQNILKPNLISIIYRDLIEKTCEPLFYFGHCVLYSFSLIKVSFNISKFLVETVSVIQGTMTKSK